VARVRAVSPDDVPEELRPPAAVLFAAAGESDPPPAETEMLGFRAARAGDLSRARALYREAVALAASPEREARLALGLGELAAAAGDWPDARPWLARAVELARDLPEVLARGLEGLGRVAAEHDRDEPAARGHFERAMGVVRAQAGRFTHRTDAAAYRERHLDPLCQLLRSLTPPGTLPHTPTT
jgi:hypothetical protein